MNLREITAADDQKIAAIIRQSLEQAQLAIPGTAYFDPELDHLSAYYQETPRRQYFILENDGELLGGVGIAEFDESRQVAELQKLYLTEAARGQNLSPRLMAAALDFAQSVGYQSVYLESHHSLQAAVNLYEKFGFVSLPEPLLPTPHNAMDRFYLKELVREARS